MSVIVQGVEVYTRDSGHGDPVLFLHGNPDSADTWHEVIARLERHFRCIAIDLPGFARSKAPAGFDCSIDNLGRFIASLLESLATALRQWRPLLAPGGVAVISELSWFGDDIPAPARTYWEHACPEIGSEAENIAHACAQGFEVLGVHRLPAAAWWNNYYGPLQARIDALRGQADAAMRAVIRETEAEIALFRDYSEAYGYAYYVLRARA